MARREKRELPNAIEQMKALLKRGIVLAPVEMAGGALGLRSSASFAAANSGVFGDALIQVNGVNRIRIVQFLRQLDVEVDAA